jgi:hypothetical protein
MKNAMFCPVVGVPEIITELLELSTRVRPAGKPPFKLNTLHLKGATPPVP